jgi:hypothetical protein
MPTPMTDETGKRELVKPHKPRTEQATWGLTPWVRIIAVQAAARFCSASRMASTTASNASIVEA